MDEEHRTLPKHAHILFTSTNQGRKRMLWPRWLDTVLAEGQQNTVLEHFASPSPLLYHHHFCISVLLHHLFLRRIYSPPPLLPDFSAFNTLPCRASPSKIWEIRLCCPFNLSVRTLLFLALQSNCDFFFILPYTPSYGSVNYMYNRIFLS